jgi:hypothetical protein
MRRQTHHTDVVPGAMPSLMPSTVPRRRLFGAGTGLVALFIAASLGLSACSANSNTSASSAAGVARPDAQGGKAQGNASSGSGTQANGGSVANGSAANLSNRSLIITAGLQVKTDDAAAAARRAQIIAEGAGGYVAGESIGPGSQSMPSNAPSTTPDGSSGGAATQDQTQDQGSAPATLPDVTGSSDSTQALLVLRVPPQSFDSVLGALAGRGSVTFQSRTATDVTGRVADVGSRVNSARAAIAELRALIDKAASMNDLIALEQALAQRESDFESLESQQAALADQVQYATITVGYYSQGAPAAPPAVRTGFMRGLTVGWHGFLAVVRALLAAIGWLVPYAAVVAVLWWPVRRLVRRSKTRRGTRTPALAPSEPPEPPTSSGD